MVKDASVYVDLFTAVTKATDDGSRTAAWSALVESVQKDGPGAMTALLEPITKAATDKKNTALKVSALNTINQLAEKGGANANSQLFTLIPIIMIAVGDKAKPVAGAAARAATTMSKNVNPYSAHQIIPLLLAQTDRTKAWNTKVAALDFLSQLSETIPKEVSKSLPAIVPVVSECMWDTRKEVCTQASAALLKCCSAVGNPDIEPFVNDLIKAIAKPSEVPAIVYKLASTTFVQTVEAPALAIMVPVLLRGYREKNAAIKRQCAVIVDNMTKLVDEPHSAEPFLAELIPENDKVMTETSEPECRACAKKTQETLLRVRADPSSSAPPGIDSALVKATLTKCITAKTPVPAGDAAQLTIDFVSRMAARAIDSLNFDAAVWNSICGDYLAYFTADGEAITKEFKDICERDCVPKNKDDEDDEEGEDLCNCEFSLAYGNKILLNNAKLRLKKGRRYGLVGGNFVGKSTLLRSIANGQLEGFPPPEELTSVYVEADIPTELADYNVIDFVRQDEDLKNKSLEEITTMLKSVDFTDVMINGPVTALSGGWRMKLALSRAILRGAQILLLDEPTNHLDFKNVAWAENYLMNLKDVTCIAVSHDSGFLDKVVQDIIHFENLKLKKHKGNLSQFIKTNPDAKAYYELKSDKLTFHFPEPGFLDGVKVKSKALIKMKGVGFTYPNTTRQILFDVNIYVSMASRIAVVGPNGAGKSTMIKVLTGELIPQDGDVTKHANVRIAYVAQHAFHHIELHLEKSPNAYVQWRYSGGDDKESIDKATNKLTPEEEEKMKKPVTFEGVKRVVEKLMGRRTSKKTHEYEVKWMNKTMEENCWVPRDVLEKGGFKTLCNRIDDKVANEAMSATRPLTQAMITKHFEDVGLEVEFSVHNQIRQLSGGQKVKVVLGSCMWNNPHILILDEPTNYLDRDSLGALAGAITEFGGGVLLVSHHLDFTTALCTEKWVVDAGRLIAHNQPGEYQIKGEGSLDWKPEEETVDGAGNVVAIKKAKKKNLSRKEKLALAKAKKVALALGQEWHSDSDWSGDE